MKRDLERVPDAEAGAANGTTAAAAASAQIKRRPKYSMKTP